MQNHAVSTKSSPKHFSLNLYTTDQADSPFVRDRGQWWLRKSNVAHLQAPQSQC